MYRYRYFIVLVCMVALSLGACNKLPDHTKYIPKDAVIVVGIDIKALTKKVAWNAITGSKLFQDMQKNLQGKTGDKTFEDAGVDVMNTMYMYIVADNRFGKGERVTGLIPLSDADKLETFIKGNFPGKAINKSGKIKTVMLGKGMFAGWNDKLLILMNRTNMAQSYSDVEDSTGGGMIPQEPDETQLAAEMESAFTVLPENSLVNNNKYTALEKERHDILFWMNYEQLMNKYMGQGTSGMMSGFTMTNGLWKNAAMTAGFDFDKGRITGEMRYYISDEMSKLGNELGGTNVDKEVINKLPANNLDMLFAFHISPKGIHDMLEKMGLLGFANLALTQQNMDVDYILDAFTGDMAMSLNDFNIKMDTKQADTSAMGMSAYGTSTRHVNFVYLLKLNKKQNFDKMLGLAKDMVHPMGNNAYYFSYFNDSVYLVYNDKYAVISNKYANANNCLQNSGAEITAAKSVYGHPFGFYLDFQQLMASVDPGFISSSPSDSTFMTESKKLLQNMLLSGAEFKSNYFSYHLELNFVNKEENSLIQLMDFAMKINQAQKNDNNTYTIR